MTYGATAFYRLDRNSVTDLIEPHGADVVLITKTNLPLSRSAGLDFSASGKLVGKLSYDLAGNLFYSQIDATALGAAALKSTMGLDLKASLEYRPTAADTLQLSFSRQDRRLTPQGQVSAIDLVNLGYKRELRPELALAATVSDLLDGQRFNRRISTVGLVDDYSRYQLGRLVTVGLIYSFLRRTGEVQVGRLRLRAVSSLTGAGPAATRRSPAPAWRCASGAPGSR